MGVPRAKRKAKPAAPVNEVRPPADQERVMYQTIMVEGWKDVDVREVIEAMSPFSLIVNADPSPECVCEFEDAPPGRH